MARTKQTAREGRPRQPPPHDPKIRRITHVSHLSDRSTLLQLMGFPVCGDADAQTVQPDWAAVLKRLQSHPDEAFTTERPVCLALNIESDSITKELFQAFRKAAPEVGTDPRENGVMAVAQNNPKT